MCIIREYAQNIFITHRLLNISTLLSLFQRSEDEVGGIVTLNAEEDDESANFSDVAATLRCDNLSLR